MLSFTRHIYTIYIIYIYIMLPKCYLSLSIHKLFVQNWAHAVRYKDIRYFFTYIKTSTLILKSHWAISYWYVNIADVNGYFDGRMHYMRLTCSFFGKGVCPINDNGICKHGGYRGLTSWSCSVFMIILHLIYRYSIGEIAKIIPERKKKLPIVHYQNHSYCRRYDTGHQQQ